MNISRKAQLWLADRHPAFDRPGIYRRPASSARPSINAWDRLLIFIIAVLVGIVGIGAIVAGIFMLGVIL